MVQSPNKGVRQARIASQCISNILLSQKCFVWPGFVDAVAGFARIQSPRLRKPKSGDTGYGVWSEPMTDLRVAENSFALIELRTAPNRQNACFERTD